MKTIVFSLVLLFTIPTILSKGKKGFLIKKNGTHKRVKLFPVKDFVSNELKIRFLDGKQKKAVTPDNYLGYAYKDQVVMKGVKPFETWVHYKTLEVDEAPKPFSKEKILFLHWIADGAIQLFIYHTENRGDLENPYNVFYYVGKDVDNLKLVDRRNYKKVLTPLFKDYSALDKVLGTTQYNFSNIQRMVKDYNYMQELDEDGMIYRVAPITKGTEKSPTDGYME